MYLFVYRSNDRPLPEAIIAQNRQAWQEWNAELHEEYGIKTPSGGKVVSAQGVEEYTGNIRGVSIVEADTLEEAIEKAKKSPSITYGGDVIVLAEYQTTQ